MTEEGQVPTERDAEIAKILDDEDEDLKAILNENEDEDMEKQQNKPEENVQGNIDTQSQTEEKKRKAETPAEENPNILTSTDSVDSKKMKTEESQTPPAVITNTTAAIAASASKTLPHSNIFVNNLPLDIFDEQLTKMFEPFGTVISAKVMVNLTTGQSKSFGFVKFEDVQSAEKAILQMNGKIIREGQKPLVVKLAESSTVSLPSGTPSPTIYVKGIPLTLSEKDLLSLFASYGTIVSHKLLKDKITGSYTGQCFLTYQQIESADYAISALHGYIFPGHNEALVVRFADTEEEKQKRKLKKMRKQIVWDKRVPQAYMQPQYQYGYNYNYNYPYYGNAASAYPMSMQQPMFEAPPPAIYVCNIPPSADETLLYNLFKDFGTVKSVRAIKDPSTGLCKGIT